MVDADLASTDSGDPILESNDNSTVTAEAEPPTETRGEKRRHESPSPDRSQRKRSRSRSPIREDEPEMDADSVQLSWSESLLNFSYAFVPIYFTVAWYEDSESVCARNSGLVVQEEYMDVENYDEADEMSGCNFPDLYIALFVPMFYVLVVNFPEITK